MLQGLNYLFLGVTDISSLFEDRGVCNEQQ